MGCLYATEVEIERVNVDVGFHWRAPKKQEPLPKERLRALLDEQSGVMMTKVLTIVWVFVKRWASDPVAVFTDNIFSEKHSPRPPQSPARS